MMAAFERPVRGLEALARDIPARICLATQVGRVSRGPSSRGTDALNLAYVEPISPPVAFRCPLTLPWMRVTRRCGRLTPVGGPVLTGKNAKRFEAGNGAMAAAVR